MYKKSEAPLDEICYKICQINFTTRTPWCTSNNVKQTGSLGIFYKEKWQVQRDYRNF